MNRTLIFSSAALLAAAASFTSVNSQQNEMSFFITSVGSGDGANLGGLSGADAHCQQLAEAAGSSGKTWRAYLSAHGDGSAPAVDARNRIGFGPWYNAEGVQVASGINDLHSVNNNLNKQTALTENGATVNGRGDSPNQHDILTGSTLDGRELEDSANHTCSNWTSNGSGSAHVGHFDRTGGGQNPTSWNSAHGSRGCSQSDLVGTGGNGYFYCFAID
ncbi:MAG: hypothetical protein VXY78_06055 [Pseudomonadota bacterium]|nr:hypothetical protein [Pseudomonadota bacterium]MEC8587923.1 hypothetical protein [Pseudomonadota bacterium]